MKAKRLEVLEKLKKGELTIEQADNELLVLYNVSSSTCNEIHTQTDDDYEPIIKHFKDESGYDTSFDSKPMGGFSDW